MNEQTISDMMFISRMASLTHTIADIDVDRLNELVKGSDDPESLLYPTGDGVSEKIRAALAIMAFAAMELKKVVPELKEVKDGSVNQLSKIMPPDQAKELVDKMLKTVKDYVEEH